MAKKVLLLRHAKSSWRNPGQQDFDRPLNQRGREAAARMGRYMTEQGLVPDFVLCSAACRALQTWELVAESLDADCQVKQLRGLYLASAKQLLDALRRAPDEADCVLLIGHNPGMERLASSLSGPGSDPEALDRLGQKYPTSALAELQFDVAKWIDLSERSGRLTRFVVPCEL
jgi:phosphohistidine phosphatase